LKHPLFMEHTIYLQALIGTISYLDILGLIRSKQIHIVDWLLLQHSSRHMDISDS